MDWTTIPVTGNEKADFSEQTTFTVERARRGFALWYGNAGRRLLVGSFPTAQECKAAADDIADSLLRNRKLIGD